MPFTENPVFCAIDTTDKGTATTLAARIADAVGGVKLGLEFFCAQGPKGVVQVARASDLPLFLDLKFHDIPNTVACAVRAVASLKPALLTLQAVGGRAMMEAAREAAAEEADRLGLARPRLLGVTVLTSLDEGSAQEAGLALPLRDQVVRLARLCREAGLDGAVCSPHEAAAVRAACGSDFLIVTPGIRPSWSTGDDQKRFAAPETALAAGADLLVVGRPITAQSDPAGAALRLRDEVAAARQSRLRAAGAAP